MTIPGQRTTFDMMISEVKITVLMKTLEFVRDEKKNRVAVACAGGVIVSVYGRCAYCRHCTGVVVGKRVMPSPQAEALSAVRRGTGSDDSLMSAAMMFNTLVRDGSAIVCSDDRNQGYQALY